MPRKSKEEEVKEGHQSIDDLDALRGYGVSSQMIERLRAVGVTSPKHLLLFNAEELMEPLNLSELDTARRESLHPELLMPRLWLSICPRQLMMWLWCPH
ncbi:MAG: hypothetical protein RXN86_04860 [Vulcanisaeta sp.]